MASLVGLAITAVTLANRNNLVKYLLVVVVLLDMVKEKFHKDLSLSNKVKGD